MGEWSQWRGKWSQWMHNCKAKRTHIYTQAHVRTYVHNRYSWDKTSGSTLMHLITHGNQGEGRLSGDSEWQVATLSTLQYFEQGKHIPLGSLEGWGREENEKAGWGRKGEH